MSLSGQVALVTGGARGSDVELHLPADQRRRQMAEHHVGVGPGEDVLGVPEEGESAEVDGFRLTVLVMDGRRVERVRVERIDPSLGNGRNAQGDP